jgi:hypothetical protein
MRRICARIRIRPYMRRNYAAHFVGYTFKKMLIMLIIPYIIAADLFISRCCSSSRNANAMSKTACKAIPRLLVDNDCDD